METTQDRLTAGMGDIVDLSSHSGGGGGGCAKRLIRANMDPGILRPWLDDDGRSYCTLTDRRGEEYQRLVGNATLTYDQWKYFDDSIMPIARQRLSVVNAFERHGMVFRMDGMSATVLQYQRRSGMGVAQMAMIARTRGIKDSFVHDTGYLPLPFTFADFDIDIREFNMWQRAGQPLDTLMAEGATLVVSEFIENVFVNGAGGYATGGGTIYGMLDFPGAITYPLGTPWTTSGVTGRNIVDMVLGMIGAAKAQNHHGPKFLLFVPATYEMLLYEEYSTLKGDGTVHDQLMKIGALAEIVVSDFMPTDKVVLIEAQSRTARAVIGLDPTIVEWDEEGGLATNYKILSIIVPQFRQDKNSTTGIVIGA